MKFPEIELLNSNIWKSPDRLKISRPRFVLRYELECYIGDGGETCIDGDSRPLTNDSISFSRPGQIRNSRFPFTTRFVYFDLPHPDAAFEQLLSRIPTFTAPEPSVAALFDRILREFDPNDPQKLLPYALLIEILSCLAADEVREPSAGVQTGQAEIFRAICYMKANLPKKLTAAEMAAEAGYSVQHFTARFRELTGSTPYEYFLGLKIREAQRLLLSGDISVTELAERLSFSSTSHFCCMFRRYSGRTPVEFAHENHFSFYEINQ